MPKTPEGPTTKTAATPMARDRTKTVAYDVAEQLRTPQERAAYLEAWFVEAPDDDAGIARALGDVARGMAHGHTLPLTRKLSDFYGSLRARRVFPGKEAVREEVGRGLASRMFPE